MPQKNKGNKKKKKTDGPEKRELILKEEGQEYAQVARMLGNGRLEAVCVDGKKRLCIIRGKMRKHVWIHPGDTILISLREYQDGKGDVIHKYTPVEARELKKMGVVDFQISENANDDNEEGMDSDDGDDVEIDFADV